MKTILSLVAATCLLAGCETTKPAAQSGDAATLQKIAAAAQDVSSSMRKMAALRAGQSQAASVALVAPPGLDVPVSITWTGPIDLLVKKVAELSGYTYDGTLGTKPMAPVNVSISVTGVTAFDILADAGAQAGTAADIIIRPDTKKLALRYPPTTPNGGYVKPN